MLTKSGIAPLDARLGGIVPGRTYVLSGASGTGKSLACLEFLHAALARGEQTVMLTHDDPADLLAQGAFLGLDLEGALVEERLVLLRYQLDFARRFGRASSPDEAFEELRRLMGECRPTRIAIDSIAPIVDAGTAAGAGVQALLAFLDASAATTLVTYPGDFAGRYDRRLEPLVQRAGAVLHLSSDRERGGLLEIRKVRFAAESTAPVPFVIRAGAGLVPMLDAPARRAHDLPEQTRRRVLVLGAPATVPDELLETLRTRFDVTRRLPTDEGPAAISSVHAGAILVGIRRDSIEEALATVRGLRSSGSSAPIALVTAFTLRALDRARALRAGADDFLGGNLLPEEFLTRVDRLARQGRSIATSTPDDAPALPDGVDSHAILDERAFRDVVRARLSTTSSVPFFTLVRLTPARADGGAIDTLAQAARAQVRVEGGDLAARFDDGVAVYLHSARRKDVPPFVARMRDAWRAAGGGELAVTTAAFPTEEAALHEVLGGPAA